MKNKITYLDTYNDDGLTYEDYKEWCEEMEREPCGEDSGDYYDWLRDEVDINIECFFSNLRYEKGKVQNRCVISGRLGLWNGRPTIEPVMCEDLEEAIRKCWGDCCDVIVELENGVVKVEGLHHDGRNYFEIRPLTARGAQKMLDGEEICVGNHWHTSKYGKYLY